MSFKKVNSVAVLGLDVINIEIEINIDNKGFPGFEIVGLPAREISESKERVKAAIRNSGFKFPNKKIVVNLAPADLPKKGSLYDVPIAIGILYAAGEIQLDLSKFILVGELSLNGNISKVPGVTLIAIDNQNKDKTLIIPRESLTEVSFINNINFRAFETLRELIAFICNPNFVIKENEAANYPKFIERKHIVKIEDIKGQDFAKRALMIAVAGRHSICLIGSPGSGKTLLAKAVESLLPELDSSDLLEVARINSLVGIPLSKFPPYRSISHPVSNRTLIGSGMPFSIGEITLANKGVLFLDEFTNFDMKIINNLRQPIEDRKLQIQSSKYRVVLPCDFMLVIASNPCACGYAGDANKDCICSPAQISRYTGKFKNPLMDRIDIFVNISSVDSRDLITKKSNKYNSDNTKNKIGIAISAQVDRSKVYKLSSKYNSDLLFPDLIKICDVSQPASKIISILGNKFSARSVHKIIRVSRTIADIESSIEVKKEHILEAVQYKSLF